MPKIYEGVSGIALVFYIILVVGGFIFGAKTHIDKEKRHKKERKKHQEYLEHYKALEKNSEEESIYYKKMLDPLWNYYDEIEMKTKVKPGDINFMPPPDPKLIWDYDQEKWFYKFEEQELQ